MVPVYIDEEDQAALKEILKKNNNSLTTALSEHEIYLKIGPKGGKNAEEDLIIYKSYQHSTTGWLIATFVLAALILVVCSISLHMVKHKNDKQFQD